MQLVTPKAHVFKDPPNSADPAGVVDPAPHPSRGTPQLPDAVVLRKIEKRYSFPATILEGSISCLTYQVYGWISLRLSPPEGEIEESKTPTCSDPGRDVSLRTDSHPRVPIFCVSQGAKVGSSKPGLRIKLVGCRSTDVVVVDISSVDVSVEVASELVEAKGSYVVVLWAIVVVSAEAMFDDSVSLTEADDGAAVDVTDSVSVEGTLEDKAVTRAESVVIEVVDNMSILVVSASLVTEVLRDVIEWEV